MVRRALDKNKKYLQVSLLAHYCCVLSFFVLINTLRDNFTFSLEVINTTCNQLTVTDVQYSNDGLSDVVDVFLNTSKIGQFTSKAIVNSGDGWNVFESSGQVGNQVQNS